ncbi:ribosome-associated translation inhibitor RaiA [Pigmentiphaga soli]|uniref:Ribosome hibernation promoting factor n=1 Tax=Pigmentiphaga soli TaxID=1007095 RepID=A0ABP8HDQ3_9BURK
MNLSISGHHLIVTPAIREYVMNKLARVLRHFDHVIDIQVLLSVEKLQHRADITLHLRGKDVHCEALEENLYAAIDTLIDKVDRQVIKYKDRVQRPRIEEAPKKQAAANL